MLGRTIIRISGVFAVALGGSVPARGDDVPWLATGRSGMVAADSVYASQAGLEMLQAGGNAIDAATAVSFALSVTRPESTGLGGGGFLIARFADGRVVALDFRETAPSAATPDMFVKAAKEGGNPSPSEFGHLAPAVPGVVAGRCQALARFGTLPLAKTIAPAIKLAEEGFPVDVHYVDATREALRVYEKQPALRESCGYVYETHLRGGDLRKPGESLVQPKLARLLEGIAQGGSDFFYKGPVAAAIAEMMKKHGGLMTADDLSKYEVKEREALRSTYRYYTVIGMPPPSSGGIALAETLNILESLDFTVVVHRDPVLATHFQIEAMKHAFADRARWLGDADFARVPVRLLTSKSYAKDRAAMLKPDGSSDADTYGATGLRDDSGTSHFCVVDRFGNLVVSTETINTSFGSLAAVDEWGLILNNEMDDFAAEPGKPNAFGLIQSGANAVAPGKRPLSSMTPTIVLKGERPYLLLGASGGPRIISSVLNVLLGVTDYGLPLDRAMTAVRPHQQWKPEEVCFDTEPAETMRAGLIARGHKVSDRRKTGVVQAILRTEAGWVGASDPRKGGRPAGY